MKLSDISAEKELVNVLANSILVDTTPIPIYELGARSESVYPDDFIDIVPLSSPRSISEDQGIISGTIEFSVYCRLNPDGTTKSKRIKKILEQVEERFKHLSTEHYFYKLSQYNFLSPTIADASSGYSYTTVYLDWHSR